MSGRMTSPQDFLERARNSTSADELDGLASAAWDFVRAAVAGNSNTSEGTLSRLVPGNATEWAEQDMIIALAGNPRTLAADLSRCALLLNGQLGGGRSHNAFKAGIALALNPRTPFDALLKMIKGPSAGPEFRKVLAREATREDVLGLLAEDRSERVRNALLRRSDHSAAPDKDA